MTRSTKKHCILVWGFYDAPADLRALSTHGGDEDWVALVPPKYKDRWIGWLEVGTSFGVCDVQKIERPDGYTVYIGAHA